MKKKEPAFEEGLARLEKLVSQLEDHRLLGLDQALAAFEEGLNLSAALKKKLDEAAGRVEQLSRDLAGRPLASPLEIQDEIPLESPPELTEPDPEDENDPA